MFRLLSKRRTLSLAKCYYLIHYIFIIVLILTTTRTSRRFVRASWQQQQQQQQHQRQSRHQHYLTSTTTIPPRSVVPQVGRSKIQFSWQLKDHHQQQQQQQQFSMTSCDHNNGSFAISLAEFVQQTRLDTARHYVIGNQAGDADSIISAIALAYIDSMAAAVAEEESKEDVTPSVVPIVSVAQQDLKLRQETVKLLELVGVVNWETHLHFIDQLSSDNSALITSNNHHEVIVNQQKTVILVDHNRLDITSICSANDERQHWRVVEILDHHYDEGLYGKEVVGVHRNIAYQDHTALVGSTCTLVTERLLSQKHLLPPPYPADLTLMLLGVIVLDTVNMSPEAGKGTPRDQQAMDALLDQTDWTTLSSLNKQEATTTCQLIMSQHLGGTSLRPDLARLYDLMHSAKSDPLFWKNLSARDALRLDYKQFTCATTDHKNPMVFGLSSVFMTMDDFLTKADLMSTFQKYVIVKEKGEQHSIIVLGVMSASLNHDGNLERELLLCSLQQEMELMNSLSNYLVNETSLELVETPCPRRFQEEGSSSSVTVRRFQQGNSKASRKQVAPFILQFFEATT